MHKKFFQTLTHLTLGIGLLSIMLQGDVRAATQTETKSDTEKLGDPHVDCAKACLPIQHTQPWVGGACAAGLQMMDNCNNSPHGTEEDSYCIAVPLWNLPAGCFCCGRFSE